ncbi:serine protease [Marinobacter segnicrescens]|uniref:Serine protease n=1 Tax=Marinobacter segnicrescens TaxID=430453 RepID=A0A1I0F278_9GAMM|nr:serine protease [Marinobacter segnicrescens]
MVIEKVNMTDRKRVLPGKLLSSSVGIALLLTGCGGGGGSSDDDAGVRGTIEIAAGTRVDGDYADLWAASDESWPSGSRDTVSVPVPSTTGGYLSDRSDTYANGLGYPLDQEDSYAVSLVEGDRYFLQCFSATGADADTLKASLVLNLDGNRIEIEDACGGGASVNASGSATFTISANDGGPFRYVLSIAPKTSLSALDVSWPEPPLQVDQAIVSGSAAVANTLSSSGLRASSVMELERAIGPDTWQVRRKPGVSALSSVSDGGKDARAETIEWIREMREEFGLKAEPNYRFTLASVSPETNDYFRDPDFWNLDQINIVEAWGLSGGSWGQGVGVAVMDTGMFTTTPDSYSNWHEDLVNNVVNEGGILDFVKPDYDVDGQEGPDGVPGTPVTPDNPEATSFHGTHVAGIIAAEDNSVGTVGIAHQATILPYRVLGVGPLGGEDGTGAVDDLIAAINSIVDDRNDVDVINLSLGGLPPVVDLQVATDRANSNGILVVAAGGNSGDASAVYPAANRRVVGVGATTRGGELASYSNYGQSVDLLAPGGALNDGIVNAYGQVSATGSLSDSYAYLAGSSMAAPHVAGVYALMKGVSDSLTASQFRAQLIAGLLTNDSELSDYTLYGAGLLDAREAVTNVTAFPTVVSAWPRVVELSPSGTERRVLMEVLKQSSAADPLVSGSPDIPGAFTLTDDDGNPINVNDEIPEAVRISVDSSAVPDDRPLVEEILIPYSNGTDSFDLRIPAYVQAADTSGDRDAGRHYVLLLDANDFGSSRSRQVLASYNDGRYSYAIDDMVPGDYILVAGTDLDNNGIICENGEACAEYPETGSRQVISIGDQDLQLDMTTSFQRPTIAEMGLPRYGFRGYPVPGHQAGTRPDRSLGE